MHTKWSTKSNMSTTLRKNMYKDWSSCIMYELKKCMIADK
jgi:hypothetical protein